MRKRRSELYPKKKRSGDEFGRRFIAGCRGIVCGGLCFSCVVSFLFTGDFEMS